MTTQSVASQVRSLSVGESHVRVERLETAISDADDINEALGRIRNSMNQITNRLRKQSGADFIVESQTVMSPDRRAILCMAITTKLKEGEEEIEI